ncbi:hypothetical protein RhiirA5_406637 [Rhizophagus irregularis]|uniref:Uncharacterized protein n=1 Tax=Rhizophagus irregularis TaxID=588596 RepID=A0A2I1DTT6_9GLOM|nr:hypothetical protein RhiirA5_406637 [Rhizophagus irregularis]PKY13292.1 hypothetical protein RhiirB3_425084 [Rhizophagus irregularis]PKY27705.1 hypothetical protein RhiirB3_443512 [Rhizophagus irregularis]
MSGSCGCDLHLKVESLPFKLIDQPNIINYFTSFTCENFSGQVRERNFISNSCLDKSPIEEADEQISSADETIDIKCDDLEELEHPGQSTSLPLALVTSTINSCFFIYIKIYAVALKYKPNAENKLEEQSNDDNMKITNTKSSSKGKATSIGHEILSEAARQDL